MARVVLVGNLVQVTGGVAEIDVPARSVQQLFRQLGELHPALAPHLESGIAVSIDGQIYQDALFQEIGPDSEVFLLPAIAGGRATPDRAGRSKDAWTGRAGPPGRRRAGRPSGRT